MGLTVRLGFKQICLTWICRFRAVHQSLGFNRQLTVLNSLKIIFLIWVVGLAITLPLPIVFQVLFVDITPEGNSKDEIFSSKLPFCLEHWQHTNHSNIYFLLVHIFACFLFPFLLIMVCNLAMWKHVMSLRKETSVPLQNFFENSDSSRIRKIKEERNLRVLKLFNVLTFAFFAFWLPLYVIMVRVKFFYSDANPGSEFERHLVYSLIPLAQLLGSCNSCVNPVLYGLLNRTFRESLTLKCFRRFNRAAYSDLVTTNAASQLQGMYTIYIELCVWLINNFQHTVN